MAAMCPGGKFWFLASEAVLVTVQNRAKCDGFVIECD